MWPVASCHQHPLRPCFRRKTGPESLARLSFQPLVGAKDGEAIR
jgi:hypothetical protein